jgi:peptide subunit release factor 1 (eRF1)
VRVRPVTVQSSRSPLPTAPLSDVAELVRRPGPFLSVYLGTEAAVENAAQHAEVRWKDLRRTLADAGAPDALLDTVDPLVGPAHLRGECLVVLAGAEGERDRVVDHFPEPPVGDLARWGPLPVLAPLIEWRQRTLPHLVVLVDRTGADIVVVSRAGDERHVTVEGPDEPVTKTAAGGWSQRRYQQRAEDSWEHNAGEVAAAVARQATAADARLVVLAGDVRAKALLAERLPGPVAELVREASGGRSPDGSVDELAQEATRLVASVVAADSAEALRLLDEDLSRRDRAVAGAEAVLAALSEARVDTLLVTGDPAEQPTACFGPDPVPVALSADRLRELGLTELRQAPVVDVAVRAALGTDAAVRVVPAAPALEGGLGALLRW